MSECDHNCNVDNPEHYRADAAHFPDCPVFIKVYHYNYDTVEDILS